MLRVDLRLRGALFLAGVDQKLGGSKVLLLC